MNADRTFLEKIKTSAVAKAMALFLSALLPLSTLPEVALALPHGGVVTKGTATLSYATNRLLVNQGTSSASFSWISFNVGSNQTVQYKTPGASSVSMNFIGGPTPAQIAGKVISNGQLVFMDPDGIVFGSGSSVSAAGIRAYGASTSSGTITPTGAISNAGTLTAGTNGPIVLVGTQVSNTGTILAPSGEVVLAAGKTVTVSESPSSSLSVATTGGGAVSDSGVIEAENVDGTPGAITLQSGMNSGTTTLAGAAVLDAGAPTGGNGGSITVNGYKVVLDETAPLDVSAPDGTPGTVTIDPTVTDVGSASALEAINKSQSGYLNNSNVCIALTANINLGGSYAWTPLGNGSASSDYFTGIFNGNGHTVSGYTIGTSASPYTANDAGFIGYSTGTVENLGVSGMVYGGSHCFIGGVVGKNAGTVSNSYNAGNVSGHCDVGGVAGENYGSSAKVEYSYNTGSVSGTFVIVGGIAGGNFGGTVTDSYNTGTVSGHCDVGGVVGRNAGTGTVVKYSYNTGSVKGTGTSSSCVGGVVGDNNGTVSNSYNTGSVSGSSCIGGVAGDNGHGGTVSNSYNIGSVSGSSCVGGVAGDNNGTVSNSYNAGNMRGSNKVGGVVGDNCGTVEYSYNIGSVSGAGYSVGGVVGDNCGTVEYSYNTGSISGGSEVGGVAGENNGNGTVVKYSYNTGSVKGTGGTSSYIGGVVGDNYSTASDNYFLSSSAQYALGNSTASLGTNGTNVALSSFSTTSPTTTFSNWSTLFNAWSSGAFQFSATSAPWFMGTVYPNGNTTGIAAPILVGDLPVDTVMGSGTSVYNGSTDVTPSQTLTMGGSALTSGITANTSSANVGSSTVTPTVSLSSPTTQTSVGRVTVSSGTWTITPLSVTATAKSSSMIYGGSVPFLTGTLSSPAPNLSATWSTAATSSSNVGKYAIIPTFSYSNGANASDFTITNAAGNATALMITAPPSFGTTSSSSGAVFFDNGKEAVPPPVDELVGSGISPVSGSGGSENPDILSDTGNILDAEDAP